MKAQPARGLGVFAVVVVVLCAVGRGQVNVGRFSELQHDVSSGEVTVLNQRQIRITGLTYDGLGPQAFFWVGKGSRPNRDGVKARDPASCGETRLPRYSNDDVIVELPAGLSMREIEYLSIWCIAFDADFGNVRFGDDVRAQIDALPEPPGGALVCSPSAAPSMNCMVLMQDMFNIRWVLEPDTNTMMFKMEARLGESEWASFGISGASDRTRMLGADTAVVTVDPAGRAELRDFHLSTLAPCVDGRGVCTDEQSSAAPGGTNDWELIEADRDQDVVTVSYRRALSAANPTLDLPIPSSGSGFVVWAIGPVDENDQQPRFHSMWARTNVEVEWNPSAITDRCESLVPSGDTVAVKGWQRPVSVPTPDGQEGAAPIQVRIGPSGGDFGYAGITQRPAWGIAFYLDGVLVPAVGVERGKTYTFAVESGDNTEISGEYHPLYITLDEEGGFDTKQQAEKRAQIAAGKVLAGITVTNDDEANNVFEYYPNANGSLCQIREADGANASAATSWEQYKAMLDFNCETAEPRRVGSLTWTVAQDTPDLVYYQCVTHRNLGWRIRVFDEGKVDEDVLRAVANQDPPSDSTPLLDGECEVAMGEDTLAFEFCRVLDEQNGFRMFYNVSDTAIDVVFEAPRSETAGGWVAFGFIEEPSNSRGPMVGSNAVVVVADSGAASGASARSYLLGGKSGAAVVPSDQGQFESMSASFDVARNVLLGRFTRALAPGGGLRVLNPTAAAVLWARGPGLSGDGSGNTLRAHAASERNFDLALNLFDTDTSPIPIQRRAHYDAFVAHAVLMGLAWVLFSPTAVLIARFMKKWDPLWFQLHRALQILVCCMVLAAWVVALVFGSRAETAHLVIGCIVGSIAMLQLINGVLRPKGDAKLRPAWAALHAWSGRVVIVLAIANVFIGMGLFDAAVGWYVAVGVVFGVLVCLHVALDVYFNVAKVEYRPQTKNALTADHDQPDEEAANAAAETPAPHTTTD